MKVLVVLALVAGLVVAQPFRQLRADQPEHPGCFIWWFLPGCFFGDTFGVDPFGIYPWEKFCAKYSSLSELEECRPFVDGFNEVEMPLEEMAVPKRLRRSETTTRKPVHKTTRKLHECYGRTCFWGHWTFGLCNSSSPSQIRRRNIFEPSVFIFTLCVTFSFLCISCYFEKYKPFLFIFSLLYNFFVCFPRNGVKTRT